MKPEIDLIEQARRAGQDYLDSFAGNTDAMAADLARRSENENRVVVTLPPRRPKDWQKPIRKAG